MLLNHGLRIIRYGRKLDKINKITALEQKPRSTCYDIEIPYAYSGRIKERIAILFAAADKKRITCRA